MKVKTIVQKIPGATDTNHTKFEISVKTYAYYEEIEKYRKEISKILLPTIK